MELDQARGDQLVPRWVQGLGLLWVVVSLPFTTVVSSFVHTRDAYLFVLIFMASGAYTAPALVAGWYTLRHAQARDAGPYRLMYASLVSVFVIGLSALIGSVTGWRFANAAGIPAVVLSGGLHNAGVAQLVRRRSGRRALSVDLYEAFTVVIAVGAPLAILGAPLVLDSNESWISVPEAAALVLALLGTYWSLLLLARLGPGRGPFEACAVGLGLLTCLNVVLQMGMAYSGFTWWAPPLVFVHGLCMSMYLLIPLTIPVLLPPGLAQLPPQAQVRGARMVTVVGLAGVGGLLVATLVTMDDQSWSVPFSLGAVTLLFVLAGLRQMAGAEETRRLYRQVEDASDERRQLLSQLLDRSVHDRRRFAGQLYEQAIAAYASFRTLAGADSSPTNSASAVAAASAMVGGDLARQADSVRELVLAMRPREGDSHRGQRLVTPIQAYFSTFYGDGQPPALTVTVDEALALDWVAETVVLQVVQEALDNVRRHSDASQVDVTIDAAGDALALRVADDGRGFEPTEIVEGAGFVTMRAAVEVIGGTLTIESTPKAGTVIAAVLGSSGDAAQPSQPGPGQPRLRLVPNPAESADA